MTPVKTLYITNPEFCRVYKQDDVMYILIGDIKPQNEFYCKALQLNLQGIVHTDNKKATTIILKIIRK